MCGLAISTILLVDVQLTLCFTTMADSWHVIVASYFNIGIRIINIKCLLNYIRMFLTNGRGRLENIFFIAVL